MSSIILLSSVVEVFTGSVGVTGGSGVAVGAGNWPRASFGMNLVWQISVMVST